MYPISNYIKFYQLDKIKKGILESETPLVDLDCVVPVLMQMNDNVRLVDSVDSDKVLFYGADIIMPKLRAYIGKALPYPPQDAIGSTEWIGVSCLDKNMIVPMALFLNSDKMCEVYRCLQSGKQHPRIDYEELNDLFIDVDLAKINTTDLKKDLKTVKNLTDQKRERQKDIYNIIYCSHEDNYTQLSDLFEVINLTKYSKGSLDEERLIIDLGAVSGVSELDSSETEISDYINSDKVCLDEADIVFSKLEAYLGKLLVFPPNKSIGSTEWIGLNCKRDLDPVIGAYVLTLPEIKEVCRMLQSGKRHARIDIEELMAVKININVANLDKDMIVKTQKKIERIQEKIGGMMNKLKKFDYFT